MTDVEKRSGRRGLDPRDLAELRDSIEALRSDLVSRFGRSARPLAPDSDADGDSGGEDRTSVSLIEQLRQRLGETDWMDLFERARRRFSVLGMEERSGEVDEFGLDERYLQQARSVIDFLYDRWWRVEISGAEHLPVEGPVILVANRSGILPYDGLMIAHAVEREHPKQLRPRFLVADWLVTLPFMQPALARLGGVRACQENAERLLETGHWIAVFPEGQKGALKPFSERYRLQRFGRGGFVSLAIRQRATLVPVGVIGAEEIHPVLFRARLTRRVLGAPLPVTPTFPLLGPLGLVPLPTRWRIRFGDPLDLSTIDPDRADDPLFVNRMRERVRGTIQDILDAELRRDEPRQ